MIIFETPSQEEAQEIARRDPAVKAPVVQAQVRPVDTSFLTNEGQLVHQEGAVTHDHH